MSIGLWLELSLLMPIGLWIELWSLHMSISLRLEFLSLLISIDLWLELSIIHIFAKKFMTYQTSFVSLISCWFGNQTLREGLRMRKKESQVRDQSWAPLSTSPSSPFIGEVWGEVLFIPHGRACIYKNATRGYKWILMSLVFTKTPPKATNGPKHYFSNP